MTTEKNIHLHECLKCLHFLADWRTRGLRELPLSEVGTTENWTNTQTHWGPRPTHNPQPKVPPPLPEPVLWKDTRWQHETTKNKVFLLNIKCHRAHLRTNAGVLDLDLDLGQEHIKVCCITFNVIRTICW